MDGGIRPGVWLATAVALVAALATLKLAAPAVGGEARQPTRAASSDRGPASLPGGSVDVHPAAALLSPSSPEGRTLAPRPTPERASLPREPISALTPRALQSPERLQPADSRAAAELRILQDDAARRAQALGLAPLSGAPALDGSDDGSRGELSNAFLVDSLVQEALRANEYPLGYPAEERERAFAESLVRGADAGALEDMLERALQQPSSERANPQLSGEIWEGAGH